MMHASRGLSTEQASRYYTEEYEHEYHLQKGPERTQWIGRSAEELGLEGAVEREDYLSVVVHGRHPRTHQQLVALRHGRLDRRAGWDFTVSADKSVSLVALSLGDERLIAAHDRAVRNAILAVERHAQAWVRGGKGVETTGRLAAAMFRDEESRALEPQLHTHVVIANMTRRADGEWRALHETEMYRSQRLGTAVYRAEMAREIRQLGYEVELRRNGEVGIAGITREQIERVSTRRKQILEYVAERGTRTGNAGQHAARNTRAAKRRDIPADELRKEWRALGQELQLKPVRTTLTGRAKRALKGDSSEAAADVVERALQHLSERRAVLQHRDICGEALRRGLGQGVVLSDVEKALAARADLHWSADGLSLVTEAQRELEKEVLRMEKAGRNRRERLCAPGFAGVDAVLTPEQRSVVRGLLENRHQVMGLEGKAGVGKSYALREVVRALHASGRRVRGMAPTGRAAEALREAGIAEPKTVESVLLEKPAERQPGVWIVDEAGLLDAGRMLRLLQRADYHGARVILVGDRGQHHAVEAGQPFAQLIENGMPTERLGSIRRQRDAGLLQVVEHLSERRVGLAVRALREQGRVVEVKQRGARHAAVARAYVAQPEGTLVIAPTNAERQDLNRRIRGLLVEEGRLGSETLSVEVAVPRDLTREQRRQAGSYEKGDLVTFRRTSREMGVKRGARGRVLVVNEEQNQLKVLVDGQLVTVRLNRLGALEAARPERRELRVGDRLAVRENLQLKSGEGVKNGSLGTVLGIPSARRVRVRLDDGRVGELDLSQPRVVDHGYAVTSHVSQGQTVERVYMVVDSRLGASVVNQRQAYVSVSRARLDVRVYTDDEEALERVWGRDDQGSARAMDLETLPLQVREWRQRAVANEREARKKLTGGLEAERASARESVYEAVQRQRSDLDVERHFGVRAGWVALRGARLDGGRPAGAEEVALRNELYDLRHPGGRSGLGPLPGLSVYHERCVHELVQELVGGSGLGRVRAEQITPEVARQLELVLARYQASGDRVATLEAVGAIVGLALAGGPMRALGADRQSYRSRNH